jgi:hypothetical protein
MEALVFMTIGEQFDLGIEALTTAGRLSGGSSKPNGPNSTEFRRILGLGKAFAPRRSSNLSLAASHGARVMSDVWLGLTQERSHS